MHFGGRQEQKQIQKAFMATVEGLRHRLNYTKSVKREKSKLRKIRKLQLYDLFLKRKRLKQLNQKMGFPVTSPDIQMSQFETLSLVSSIY